MSDTCCPWLSGKDFSGCSFSKWIPLAAEGEFLKRFNSGYSEISTFIPTPSPIVFTPLIHYLNSSYVYIAVMEVFLCLDSSQTKSITHAVKMSGQPHVPSTLPSTNDPPIPFGCEVMWVPDTVSTWGWGRKEKCCPCRKSNPFHPPIISHFTDWAASLMSIPSAGIEVTTWRNNLDICSSWSLKEARAVKTHK
jgi:hypothetical protein